MTKTSDVKAMRRRALAPCLALLVLWAAGPSLGSPFQDKPKPRWTPAPSAAAGDGLRGPLPAPAAPQITLLPTGAGTDLSDGAVGAVMAAAPTLLRSTGDPAPMCRAECAKARIICSATDDLGCDPRWAQCAADCSVPTLR